jgi:signal transduction histidine kinase
MIQADFKRSRILIVDDQIANICLLQNILSRVGYVNVKSITDSREVLEEVEACEPDLIILDLMMPHLDGFEVMQQLGTVIPADNWLPILVLTADATAKTKSKALAGGATDFLHKPFDASEIFMRIRNLLQARHFRAQLRDQNESLEDQVTKRTQELADALSELKSAQGRVVQQERLHAFSEMAGGVVHDFNNTLMAVVGYSEILLRRPELLNDHKTVLEYLKTMNTAGRDASQVVTRLRDFYRPREQTDIFESVDFNTLLEQIVPLTQPKWKNQALSRGSTITLQLELQKVPPISGIAAELRELLTNLVFNAVDAMPAGGVITLRTRREDQHVVVEIADTGTGMTPEVRERCLEPFFSTKEDRGTGLGLSMVFGTIQRHEGVLEIDSEVGKGTTFRLRLPSQTTTFVAAEPGAEELLGRTLHVLVADDDAVSCDVVSNYLTGEGHTVAIAKDGYETLEKCMSGHFDLFVVDGSMPGMTGLQIAAVLQRMNVTQPLILVTGSGSAAMKDKLDDGVALVLHKPVTESQLREGILKVVRGRREELEETPLEAVCA